MSKSVRELYLEARALAHRAGPGAIKRLAELAGIPLEPGERWESLQQLDVDPRVVYLSALALAERAYGRPEAYNPDRDPADRSEIDVTVLTAEERAQLRGLLEKSIAGVRSDVVEPAENAATNEAPDRL
jgi:hypothetical protein